MARTGTAAAGREAGSARRLLGLLALLGVLAVVFLLSLGVGSRDVGLLGSWSLLLGGGPESAIVRELRLPRGLLAVVVGAGLGLAGALMQGLTRNPLADPGLLGVHAGAAAAVVVGVGVGVTTPAGRLPVALLGAAIAMVVVHVLAGAGRGGGSPDRLVLAGAAVAAVLTAAVQGVLVLSPSTFDALRSWNLGSLSGRGVEVLAPVTLAVVPAGVAGLLLARGLDALALGARTGASLGLRATRLQLAGGAVVTVLCGAATAAVGPIAFLGLAVPHVVRTLVGPGHRWVLPYAVVLAPTVLLVADVVGRVIAPPSEVPVGVVAAVLGAPVFVAVCRRRRLVSL